MMFVLLFYSVWTKENTKIYQIVKYLLSMASKNSRTWCSFLRDLSSKYNMRDPLDFLAEDPPSRSEYKEYILTKITSFHEKELRQEAMTNSCMKFLHVDLTGLRGKHHPAIANIKTTAEVAKLRPHLKMLCGNLLTYGQKFNSQAWGPHIAAFVTAISSQSDILSHHVHVLMISEKRS